MALARISMPTDETTRSPVVGSPARVAIASRNTTACNETTRLRPIRIQSYQGIRVRGLLRNNGKAIAAKTSAKAKWLRRASELVTTSQRKPVCSDSQNGRFEAM